MNKKALIIGGSSGIGRATVEKLASESFDVTIVHRDRRQGMTEFEAFTKELQGRYESKIITFNIDATDKEKVKEAVAQMAGGPCFHLVLHAISRGSLKTLNPTNPPFLQAKDLQITLEAMSLNVQIWLEYLMEHKILGNDSRFITLTSEGKSRYWAGYGAVALAKASLETLTNYLAIEMSKQGIRFNCIMAGVTDTPSLRLIPGYEKLIAHTKERNPYGRLTEPQDVADVVYLLSRPEAKWINGALIHVDGGEHLV